MADHVIWKGFLGAAVAVACFGSYAIPVKMFPTGDGIVFQWIQCCAILVVGYCSQAIAGFSNTLEPIAMIGGALWCMGNLTVVPIVSTIGLGLGMLIWGLSGMLTGWFCGHFGIIVAKEKVGIPWLNYLGVSLAVISFLLYFPIKTEAKAVEGDDEGDDNNFLKNDIIVNDGDDVRDEGPSAFKKLLAILGSILAGLFYGSNMIPVQYLSEKYPERNVMSFALSHFSGIFLTSTLILIGYIILKKNRPVFYKQSILPAIVAGVLWALAQNGWFIGDANLSLVVAFPIITTGPAVLSSIIGIVGFGEVKGFRNFAFLITAIVITISGILCISFSKPQ